MGQKNDQRRKVRVFFSLELPPPPPKKKKKEKKKRSIKVDQKNYSPGTSACPGARSRRLPRECTRRL